MQHGWLSLQVGGGCARCSTPLPHVPSEKLAVCDGSGQGGDGIGTVML